MAAVAARTLPPRPLLRALVVGLILGVLTLHHLAAHHGAADSEHHAGSEAAATHDAEPAAGVDGITTTWDAADSPSGNHVALDNAIGVTSEMVLVLSEETSHPIAGTTSQLSFAVLNSVPAITAASMVLLAFGACTAGRADPIRETGLGDRAPPRPSPERLAQLQVLRV